MWTTSIQFLAALCLIIPSAAAWTMPPHDNEALEIAEGGIYEYICAGMATNDGNLYYLNDEDVLVFTGWNRPRAVVGYVSDYSKCPTLQPGS